MIDDNYGEIGGMRIGRGNQSTCPNANLAMTNPTSPVDYSNIKMVT
jgi:hypothetical protein